MVFHSFTVEEVELVRKPLPVEDLEVRNIDNSTREVTLAWKNPTSYLTGEDLTIEGIKVTRNGSLLTTLTDPTMVPPGAEVAWTDTPETSGIYEYELSVVDADGKESDKCIVKTPFVGKPDAIYPPHAFDFSDETANSFWTIETAEAANGWGFKKTSGIDYLECLRDGYKATDSKAFSPEFSLDSQKAYKISYKAQCTNRLNEFSYTLSVEGTDESASWRSELLNENPFMPSANNTNETVELIFTPANSGNARFCWAADLPKLSSSYYNNTFRVSEVSVTEIPVVPVCATGLSALADIEGNLSVKLTWMNPAVSETGLPVGEITASVYRDGDLVETVGTTAGVAGEFTDDATKGLTSGYHTYKVIIDNAAGHTGEAPIEVSTDYVGKGIHPDYTADMATDHRMFRAVEPDPDKANGKMFVYSDGKFVLKENPKEISDALLMPLMDLQAGHVYEMTVETSHTGYYDIDFDIALSTRANPLDQESVVGTSNFKKGTTTVRFAVAESGEYFPAVIAKALTSGYSEYEYVVSGFSITDAPLVPAAPADLRAKSDFPNGRVDVSWTMPTTTAEGAALTAKLKASLYRGTEVSDESEPLVSLEMMPGEKCSWADETPQEGLNAYLLVISNPGDGELAGGESEPIAVVSDYHAAARELPYEPDFTTDEGRSGWTFLDESRTKGQTFGFNEDNCLYLLDGTSATSSGSNLNDWIVSPLFILEEGVTYTVKFEGKSASGSSAYNMPSYNIYVGDEPTSASLLAGQKITEGTAPKLTGEFQAYSHDFTLSAVAARAESADEDEDPTPDNVVKTNKFVGLHFGLGNYSYPEVTVRSIKFQSDKPISAIADVADDGDTAIMISGDMITASSETALLEVFDLSGQRVAASRGSLNAATLASGLYVIRVTDGNKINATKYIKR